MLADDHTVPSSQRSLSPALASQPLHSPVAVPDLQLIHRFRVKEISEVDQSVLLHLSADKSPFVFKCTLTGTWTASRVAVGDVVNVFSTRFTDEDGFLVSDTDGFVVVNPDNLISCTSVASTLYCARKSWLSEKFKGWGSGNKIMLLGTLVHELLQACCWEKLYQADEIEARMRELLSGTSMLQAAYLNEMTEQDLEKEVRIYIPWIVQWMAKYVVGEAGELHDDPRKKLKIIKFVDIEDNIWCHYNGTKGKVDFTVEVRLYDNKNFTSRKAVLPMELKTGKCSFSAEHVAQATLYSMMMHNRQFGECDSALLLYLKDGPKLKHVVPSDPTRIALIQRRNDQEYFTRQTVVGPEFKDSSHSCSSCDHLLDCSLMARNFEPDRLQNASAMPFLADAATEHLTQDEVSFFGEWIERLYIHRNGPNISGDFWNESAEGREEQGLSLACMHVVRKKKFTYTFARADRYSGDREVSAVTKDWNMRERVAISLDQQPDHKRQMVAILTGFIDKMEEGQVTCTFDKSMQQSLEGQVFRIDRLARSATAFLSNFNSLLRLMSKDDPIAQQLRKSVIHKEKHSNDFPMIMSSAVVVKRLIHGVDWSVRKAVTLSLVCSHYSLFECSPESESDCYKFLVKFAQVAVALSQSVLLTAASLTSLDNLLLLFKSNEVPFLRLLKSSTGSQLNDHCENVRLDGCTSVSQMQKVYDSEPLVACTFSGIVSHPYYELRKNDFDFCVVLDADQPLLTQSLAPLFRCKRFLLIRNTAHEAGSDNLFSHLISDGNVFRF